MAARKSAKQSPKRKAGRRKTRSVLLTIRVPADRLVSVLKSLPGRTAQVLDIA